MRIGILATEIFVEISCIASAPGTCFANDGAEGEAFGTADQLNAGTSRVTKEVAPATGIFGAYKIEVDIGIVVERAGANGLTGVARTAISEIS